MTMEEINAEIAASRQERKLKQAPDLLPLPIPRVADCTARIQPALKRRLPIPGAPDCTAKAQPALKTSELV
jgi:hypothetical protein